MVYFPSLDSRKELLEWIVEIGKKEAVHLPNFRAVGDCPVQNTGNNREFKYDLLLLACTRVVIQGVVDQRGNLYA